MHELNTGRCRSHRRKQLEISKDMLVANLAVDLAKRYRDPKRRSTTRICHRTVCAFCNRLPPAGSCCFDAVARQQRTLDLHEMYVLRIDDGGISHGHLNGLCRLLDLHAAPEFLGQEISRLCNPDAQAFPGNAVGLAPNDVGTREDGDMRT